jgi:hypothetical protein
VHQRHPMSFMSERSKFSNDMTHFQQCMCTEETHISAITGTTLLPLISTSGGFRADGIRHIQQLRRSGRWFFFWFCNRARKRQLRF